MCFALFSETRLFLRLPLTFLFFPLALLLLQTTLLGFPLLARLFLPKTLLLKPLALFLCLALAFLFSNSPRFGFLSPANFRKSLLTPFDTSGRNITLLVRGLPF